jgi:hypothetical protein
MSCEERRSAGGGSLSPSKRCRPFNPPARGRGLGHLPVASLRLPCRAGDGALANLLTVQQLGDSLQERAELRRMQRLGRRCEGWSVIACTLVAPAFALRTCRRPAASSMPSPQARSLSGYPVGNQHGRGVPVAQRFCRAASMSFSISRSVRYSRGLR